jgi:hypothetical protein
MGRNRRYLAAGKFIIMIVLILCTIGTIVYNSFRMKYPDFCIIPTTTTSQNTTFVNEVDVTKPM